MDSKFGALQQLVLPAGAVSGSRIILDGINGKIQVYDSLNHLRVEISAGPNGIRVFTSDTGETVGGHFNSLVDALGRVASYIDSPQADALQISTIVLAGGSSLHDARISHQSKTHEFFDAGDGLGTDIQLNGKSLPRGVILPVFRSTSNDAARAASINTDMVITPTVDAARLYRIHVKGQITLGTISTGYELHVSDGGTVGGNDGTFVNQIQRWNASETASNVVHAEGSLLYVPGSSGAKTLRLRNGAVSGGTIAFTGAAGRERQFWIEDIGHA